MAVFPPAGNGAPFALWVSFLLPVLVLLALDLGHFLRSSKEPTIAESVGWTAVWAALAAVFGVALTKTLGPAEGLSFLTAYVVEQALSVDNLFVFLLVFGELAVPRPAQKRALAWGVLGALVLRVVMLALGGAFLAHFHALGWFLGGLLVAMGLRAAVKLWRESVYPTEPVASAQALDPLTSSHALPSSSDPPSPSLARRMLGRWFPLGDAFDGDRFVTTTNGRTFATPLLLAVISILFADVVFALDSVPAVLGVSQTPIVVVTSNVFAVLGLRSLFFLVQGLLARLRYLPHGLAAVLVVVGGKMLLGVLVTIPTWLSLASVLAVLGAAVVASIHATRRSSVVAVSKKEGSHDHAA